jgi:hypothetical protein
MYAEGFQGHTKRASPSNGTLNRDRPGQGDTALNGSRCLLVHGSNTVNKPLTYAISRQNLKYVTMQDAVECTSEIQGENT